MKTLRNKAPRSPREASPEVVDVKPSAPGEAQEKAVDAQEEACQDATPSACLKQRATKPMPSGLDPVRDSETARARGRNGGLASAATRRKRKELREYMEAVLKRVDGATGEINAMAMAIAMVEKAKTGDVRAFEAVCAAVGEKSVVLDHRSGDGSMSPGRLDLTHMSYEQLMALTKAEWTPDDDGLLPGATYGEAGQ